MADRFYCPEAAIGERLRLQGDEARHLGMVPRIAVGATVEVFDGKGHATRAEVLAVGKHLVELGRVGPPLTGHSTTLRLTLATAVPKGDRFDWLVEKATEIGVDRLVPLRTERSVVDPGSSKLERLRRAVIESSKQCGRNRLMEIAATVDWHSFLDTGLDQKRLLANPGGGGFPLRAALGVPERAVIAVGPEGGFTGGEVSTAREAGWEVVGLGPSVLRIETAGLVGCARLLALGESNNERADG